MLGFDLGCGLLGVGTVYETLSRDVERAINTQV